LKSEGLRFAPSKKLETLVKAGGTSARAFGPVVVPAKHEEPAGHSERRRAQRVTLRVAASVHVALQGKQASFQANTVSVSSSGALLVLEKGLVPETRLVLEHGRTRERVACRVTRPAREIPEGFQVSVEFDSPAPNFWGIAFPPADWQHTE
jgi:hypothetical protein